MAYQPQNGIRVKAIEAAGSSGPLKVFLDDSEREFDLVICATGVKPTIDYLAGSSINQVELLVPASSTPMSIMSLLHLPVPLCALVVINGTFVHVADRATRRLVDGDVLAIWPPIAGG